MRYLHYTNYQSGESGLSNGIMSIEIGVVMAFLTNRFLLIDGNRSPPANIVTYGDRVDNTVPSRVTDLIDIPIPWSEPTDDPVDGLPSHELSDRHLGTSVFYVPGTVDIKSADAESFANGRTIWLNASGASEDVAVLRVSENRDREHPRYNLTFYSYFFYLDDQTRRSVYRMLARMQAKRELAELARKVAGDIGSFNAVHLRRGDFKVTYGVTTLDRQPWEAIEALDHHFKRQDPLVIVTDERDDPFFSEIKQAFPHHIFIDHHVLDEYGDDFDALPHRDSLALAYLSQLIAAESEDFIGTMTSTFTAIIQRYRGNRGKAEPFKFLWNELPDQGDRLERGRHPVSECVPLDHCVMIEESSGPYTWNRYSPRIAANWMREWPESFLTPKILESGKLSSEQSSGSRQVHQLRPERSTVAVDFDGLGINLKSKVPRLTTKLGESFGSRAEDSSASNIIAELEVGEVDGVYRLSQGDREIATAESYEGLARNIKLEVVRRLASARRRHVWLEAFSFLRSGRALVLVGDLGPDTDWLADSMCSNGWELLWDDVVPVRVDDLTVTPLGRSTWPRGAALRIDRSPHPLAGLVVVERRLQRRDELALLSPSVGVAELIRYCVDFAADRDRAVERLCRLVEKRPVGKLSYSSAESGADALTLPFLQAEQDSVKQKELARQADGRTEQPKPAAAAKRSNRSRTKSKATPKSPRKSVAKSKSAGKVSPKSSPTKNASGRRSSTRKRAG